MCVCLAHSSGFVNRLEHVSKFTSHHLLNDWHPFAIIENGAMTFDMQGMKISQMSGFCFETIFFSDQTHISTNGLKFVDQI